MDGYAETSIRVIPISDEKHRDKRIMFEHYARERFGSVDRITRRGWQTCSLNAVDISIGSLLHHLGDARIYIEGYCLADTTYSGYEKPRPKQRGRIAPKDGTLPIQPQDVSISYASEV